MLMNSAPFVAAVQAASPSLRADDSLTLACTAYPHLVVQVPLLPELGAPENGIAVVAFTRPIDEFADGEDEDGITYEHLAWECFRPFNLSWTIWFAEFMKAICSARTAMGLPPLRAFVNVEMPAVGDYIGFRDHLVVYVGHNRSAIEGFIYAAGPTAGCYATQVEADEAICKSFFQSGAAYRTTLLGGPGFPFDGIHLPTDIGNLVRPDR